MAMLMLTCPNTDRKVPTGVDVGEGAQGVRMENNTLGCPACGKNHVWSLRNGEVVVVG